MLKIIGISKSGYYDWKKRKPSKTKLRKEKVSAEIKKIHSESHSIYGAPKITQILRKNGEKISERTVSTYMKEMGVKAKYIKHKTKTTINSNFSDKLTNILDRNFNTSNPNEFWCTDITYIYTYDEEFVYLTSVMDLYSRKIIAWKLSKTMEVGDVLECIEIAKSRRKFKDDILVIHSDRGVQYTSSYYEEITDKIKRSYSKKANPWDNACIESFHSLIKREWLKDKKILNYQMAYTLVFEYIETFYNTVRIHSHCDYLSPNQYEARK